MKPERHYIYWREQPIIYQCGSLKTVKQDGVKFYATRNGQKKQVYCDNLTWYWAE